jgi:hypothetical protein
VIQGVISSTWAEAAVARSPRRPKTTTNPAATERATTTARATAAPAGWRSSSPVMNHPR